MGLDLRLSVPFAPERKKISNPQPSWGFDGEPPKAVINDL